MSRIAHSRPHHLGLRLGLWLGSAPEHRPPRLQGGLPGELHGRVPRRRGGRRPRPRDRRAPVPRRRRRAVPCEFPLTLSLCTIPSILTPPPGQDPQALLRHRHAHRRLRLGLPAHPAHPAGAARGPAAAGGLAAVVDRPRAGPHLGAGRHQDRRRPGGAAARPRAEHRVGAACGGGEAVAGEGCFGGVECMSFLSLALSLPTLFPPNPKRPIIPTI